MACHPVEFEHWQQRRDRMVAFQRQSLKIEFSQPSKDVQCSHAPVVSMFQNSMNEPENFYEVLDVSRKATAKEIVSAYRVSSLKHHPDKNPGNDLAASQFVRISQAYQVLSDEKTRPSYDAYLSAQDAIHERERLMVGRRADFRASLLGREAEAKKQRQKVEEAEANFKNMMEKAKSEATTLSQLSDQSARTLRLRWQSNKHLTESILIDTLPGIQRVTINTMHTGAEILFFTAHDSELALQREYTEFKLDRLLSDSSFGTSEKVPFAKYEALTIERLHRLANPLQ